MPNFVDGSYGSRAGEALISKVLAGRCKMKYTRAAVGKGVLPNGKSPKIMTEAMDFVMSANIASISNPVNGECQVSVQIKSDDVREGFYTTNVVLFAEDPDIGEILFTYLLLEESPEWISSSSSSIGKVVTFDIIAAVGEIESVSAVIDPESIATIENVKKLLKEHDEDQKAHRSVLDDYKEDINELVTKIDDALLELEKLKSKVDRLNDAIFNDITKNPFLIRFDDLNGLVVKKGNFNKAKQRIEC